MRGLSLVVASGGHSSSRCAGLSLSRPLLLWSTGSRRTGSVIVAHKPSCSAACGIFPDQGSNPCPLHWQADSQPLRHQGSPSPFLIYSKSNHKMMVWPIFSKPLLSLTPQVPQLVLLKLQPSFIPKGLSESHDRASWVNHHLSFPRTERGIMEHRTFSSETQNIPGNWDKFVSPDWHLLLSCCSPRVRLPLTDQTLKSLKWLWPVSKHFRTLQQSVPCKKTLFNF